MEQTVQERAATAALATIAAHWDEDQYPVDPFAIARSMGVKVLRGDLPGDISGVIRLNDHSEIEMYVDTDESPRRQRFTAAHEVGHLVDRIARNAIAEPFVDRRGALAAAGTDQQEIFANAFAAVLLMPTPMLRSLVRQHGFNSYDVARFFDVSPAAAELRMKNAGLVG